MTSNLQAWLLQYTPPPAAFVGSAIFLIICGYLGTTTVTAVLFLALGVGLGGLALAGFSINHLDIAPRYAGVLMGITNSAATLSGVIAPQVAKAITVTVSTHSVYMYLEGNIAS